MRFTKYSHSCVRLEDGAGGRLVIDPGVFSEVAEALDGVHAVLVTHEHPDHLDVDALRRAAAADPDLRVWAPAVVAGMLADLDGGSERVTAVGSGESFEAGGLSIRTYGGQHALIHPTIPVVPNLAYLVEGAVLHPGDSFTVPDVPVEVLLVPVNAPWSRVAEVIDYTVSVRAPRAYPVHDAMLKPNGMAIVEGHVTRISAPYGTTYTHLDPRESVEV